MIIPIILAAALQAPLQPKPWPVHEYAVDAGHSIVEFSIGFALTHIKGRFNQWRGTILYDSINPANSSITAIFEVKSLDTGWPHRDSHLRTSDFFDVEHYPTITFQSTRLVQDGSSWVAEGPLTMHGVTRAVRLPFHFLPGSPQRSAESRNMTLNLSGSIRLARADFGIVGGSTYNSWFDRARSATMSDSVDITFEVEAWRADAITTLYPPIEQAVERIATSGVDAQVKRLRDLRAKTDDTHWANYLTGQELLVRTLVLSGKTTDAVALARVLTELFPRSTPAFLALGFAQDAAGDRSAAARSYKQGVQLYSPPKHDATEEFPQDDEDWYWADQLVRIALEAGRTATALELARVVAEIYPQIARAQSRYGEALALAGQRTAADEAFSKALTLDPMETRALEYRRRLLR